MHSITAVGTKFVISRIAPMPGYTQVPKSSIKKEAEKS
jgi:hypothetical protein